MPWPPPRSTRSRRDPASRLPPGSRLETRRTCRRWRTCAPRAQNAQQPGLNLPDVAPPQQDTGLRGRPDCELVSARRLILASPKKGHLRGEANEQLERRARAVRELWTARFTVRNPVRAGDQRGLGALPPARRGVLQPRPPE